MDSALASGFSSLLAPVTDRQTYRNVVFLLLRLPLGIAYFTLFLTGIALGVSLVPLLVGIPILGVVLGFGGYAGLCEARILRGVLDTEIDHTPPHDSREEPLVPYVKATLTDPWSYLLVGYFLASLFVGIGTFTFVVVVFSLGIALVVAPVAYPLSATQYQAPQFDWAGGRVVIDTLPEAVAVSAVGVVVLVAGIHGANALAAGHARITAAVLGDR
jgi:hypothetical protein